MHCTTLTLFPFYIPTRCGLVFIEAITGDSKAWLMHCATHSRTTSFIPGWWFTELQSNFNLAYRYVSFNFLFLWNYCLSWELLSFKIVKRAKDLMGKKCARKIVNCYWMFAALDEAKDFKRSRPQRPSKARPRASIPVWGQRSRNWSDSK